MSIAQRKDGRFVVKYKYDGVWRQRTFRTLEDAKNFEAEVVSNETTQERLTVGELAALYLRNNKKHEHTVKNLTRCLSGSDQNGKHHTGHGEFLFDRYVDTLTRKDLERLRENMRQKGLKATTINTICALVRAVLSWGFQQDLTASNPWMGYKRVPEHKDPRIISRDKFKAVYDAAPQWLQWAMKTCYCLALRPGLVELFGLKWSAFDFERGTVTLCQGKSGNLKTVIPPRPYIEEAKHRKATADIEGIELVCPDAYGKRVTEYRYAWNKACSKAGVKMRPYDIRHLAATTMLAAGADITAVAAQLGHSDCSMTGRVYAHVTNAAQKAAAQALTL